MNVLAGSAAEILNLVTPRLSDAVFHRLHRRFPDSAAARADRPGATPRRAVG